MNYLIDVLLGKPVERIRHFGHDTLSVYGIGKELSASEWRSVFRQLVAVRFLKVDMEKRGGLRLTSKCRPVLTGKEQFFLRKDPVIHARSGKTGKRPVNRPENAGDLPGHSMCHMELLDKLKSARYELAQERSLPAYVIFHNRTLEEFATVLPDSLEEMENIHGVGKTKLDRYGKFFLEIIRKYKQDR